MQRWAAQLDPSSSKKRMSLRSMHTVFIYKEPSAAFTATCQPRRQERQGAVLTWGERR